MNADSYFAVGKSHLVCQDYARAGQTSWMKKTFAIVSDGCSGSPDTDFGARFLTLAAAQTLDIFSQNWPCALEGLGEQIAHRAFVSAHLGLSQASLDATLLALHEQPGDALQATVWGDGVIFWVSPDWELHAVEIDMGDTPGYLSYLLNEKRLQEYLESGCGKRTVRYWEKGRVAFVAESKFAPDSPVLKPEDGTSCFWLKFEPGQCLLAGIATDGVKSFRQRESLEPIPFWDILEHLADIKIPTGAFLTRSCRHFLTRICPKLGWEHTDDLGVAGIWIGFQA